MLSVINLTKNYGKSRGVKNVSISIEKGIIYGFIGQMELVKALQ